MCRLLTSFLSKRLSYILVVVTVYGNSTQRVLLHSLVHKKNLSGKHIVKNCSKGKNMMQVLIGGCYKSMNKPH